MNLDGIFDALKDRPRVEPRPFTCMACEDTGWIEVDDGLDESGKRVAQPTSRRCESVIHVRKEPVVTRTYEKERYT